MKRNAFALCVLHHGINAALVDYKQRMCTNDSNRTINYDKKINIQGLKY